MSIEKFEHTKEEQDRCIEIHDTSRRELLKRQLSNSEHYDKAILSLSSAALALSLTAIKFIIPLHTANYLWAIKTSWVLFLFTIVFSLGAFLVSNRAIKKQLSIEEDYYVKGLIKAQTENNVFSSINSILNILTGIVFIVAISLVIYFVTINIGQGDNDMAKKTPSDTTKLTRIFVTDSASIPKMQIAPGNPPTKQTVSAPASESGTGTTAR